MGIRTRWKLALFTYFAGLGGSVSYAAVAQQPGFAALAGIITMAAGIYSLLLRCPACRKSIAFQKDKLFGIPVYTLGHIPPRKCPRCQTPLD